MINTDLYCKYLNKNWWDSLPEFWKVFFGKSIYERRCELYFSRNEKYYIECELFHLFELESFVISEYAVNKLEIKNIDNLLPLQYCVNIEYLDIRTNKLKSLLGIENLFKLKSLIIYDIETIDFSILRNCKNLSRISIGRVMNIDFKYISVLSNIDEIHFYNCDLSDEIVTYLNFLFKDKLNIQS